MPRDIGNRPKLLLVKARNSDIDESNGTEFAVGEIETRHYVGAETDKKRSEHRGGIIHGRSSDRFCLQIEIYQHKSTKNVVLNFISHRITNMFR